MKEHVQRQLDELKQAFSEKLQARLREIEEAWEQGRLPMLRRLVHSLSGSAGTFGFPEVTQTAAALDGILEPLVEKQKDPSKTERLRIAALIEELGHSS
jgi:HPt (histidine-containing phosphotransfer) domain-containing protein